MFNNKIVLALTSAALAFACTSPAMAESVPKTRIIVVKMTGQGYDTTSSQYSAMDAAKTVCSSFGGQQDSVQPWLSMMVYTYRDLYITTADMNCMVPE